MKIETWGEETEKVDWSTFDELKKKKRKTIKEKELLRLKRKLGKEERKSYKLSSSSKVGPYVSSIVSVIVLFCLVAGGLYFAKIIIIDDLLITEDFAEVYGISASLVNLMWWLIIFTLPFYFILKMFMRGSSGCV